MHYFHRYTLTIIGTYQGTGPLKGHVVKSRYEVIAVNEEQAVQRLQENLGQVFTNLQVATLVQTGHTLSYGGEHVRFIG